MTTFNAIQHQISMAGLSQPRWTDPHGPTLVTDYRGYEIHVAQKKDDGTWSWAVLGEIGEDNGGLKSKDDALKEARAMIDSHIKSRYGE